MRGFMIALIACSVTMSSLALFYMAITPLISKRYSVKWRYYAWLVVVIGLIIPFRPQWGSAIVKIDVPAGTTSPVIQIGNGAPVMIPVENTVISSVSSISWRQAAAVLWLAGMIIFLAYHIIRYYYSVIMLKRWSESVLDERVLSLFHSLKAEMGISKQISLHQCSSIGSPMMLGFITPRVLLPTAEPAEDELRFILKHELVHYKRKDLYYKCLVLVATAVHWFNPIVYMIARVINVQCELSCDAEIVRNTDADTRRQYSEAIIGVVKYRSKFKTLLSTNFYEGKKGMNNRISCIMDTSKKKTGIIVLCCALVFSLGSGVAFALNESAADVKLHAYLTQGDVMKISAEGLAGYQFSTDCGRMMIGMAKNSDRGVFRLYQTQDHSYFLQELTLDQMNRYGTFSGLTPGVYYRIQIVEGEIDHSAVITIIPY